MNHRRLVVLIGVAALAVGGLGAGVAVAITGSSTHNTLSSETAGGSNYSYYQSMMGNFGSSNMMGGSYGSMLGSTEYRWMVGGGTAPGWMRGDVLPEFMIGRNTDPGKVMGRLFANAPGRRVSPVRATQLGNEIPAGATVNKANNAITFAGATADLVVLGSPKGGHDEAFRIAGLVNPIVAVRSGSRVSIEVINADPDTAHGLVVGTAGSVPSYMPMMTTARAFGGSAVWFLGDPTSAGMHAATISFTATTPGTYQYLCPAPGHAQKGMIGTFVVTA